MVDADSATCLNEFSLYFQAYPVILGDIDNSGSLSAQVIHQFAQNLKSKLVVQVGRYSHVEEFDFFVSRCAMSILTVGLCLH